MNHRIKFVVCLLLTLVVCCGLVSAVPPSQHTGTNGLSLGFSNFEYGKLGQDIEVAVHIYNLQTGLAETSNVNCSLHIYNASGNHLFDETNTTFHHTYDIEFDVPKETFTYAGLYSMQIYCECDSCADDNTDLGGFERHLFYMDYKGEETNPLPLIIAIGLVLFLLIVFSITLDKEHFLWKLLSSFIVIFSLAMIPSALINGVAATQDNLLKMAIWVGRFFVTYIFVYFNYTVWLKDKLVDWKIIKQKQGNKLERGNIGR